MVYFIGVSSYWISNEANTEEDLTTGNTFIDTHGLRDLETTTAKLITCCYFALHFTCISACIITLFVDLLIP